MPAAMPAAEVYQATSAVTIPTYPPNLIVPVGRSAEPALKFPMARMMRVANRSFHHDAPIS